MCADKSHSVSCPVDFLFPSLIKFADNQDRRVRNPARYVILRWRNQPFEPRHDKTNKVTMRPAKTQISLGIRPVWSEFSLSAWRSLGSLATHWAHSEDSDQHGRMPRLIWIFAGRTLILLVLSFSGSFVFHIFSKGSQLILSELYEPYRQAGKA